MKKLDEVFLPHLAYFIFEQGGKYNDNKHLEKTRLRLSKGNTLLTVASILKMIDENNKQLIFVRQEEEENNHYLQTLKNSGLFEVYCGDETYNKIYEFTGYNIKKWIQENMKWEEDISKEFKKYLEDNDLLKYLRW